eukprot:471205-Alexandrium_andersonii.AAC.1
MPRAPDGAASGSFWRAQEHILGGTETRNNAWHCPRASETAFDGLPGVINNLHGSEHLDGR